ncbi:hypothetical protein ASPZODRAFT_1095652 [Penicilliopsis zonata CBS 506.65]|uniref:Uncharacterized protein n=1 Tax=Penicilliopsis zonata CBS 506.65 TaxID=1073090 RepID=A0A1L9SS64_9EURO|nr:hypothetical protein ASPZODRAFT_1095652 [Penicilliopsis zonata CBS 506.65]OJJ50052.1 hypothetical protein ASPZODRAFT_1095652 [Penicilliopsis zonata CBS 506.65]
MDDADLIPQPLRIVKGLPFVHPGSSGPGPTSPLIYPRIPQRQSSLHVSAAPLSAISRSPSLGQEPTGLMVSKTRRLDDDGDTWASNEKFSMESASSIHSNGLNMKKWLLSKFIRGLNSGKWSPKTRRFSRTSSNTSTDRQGQRQSEDPSGRESAPFAPLNVPIVFVDLKVTTHNQSIGLKSVSLWISVEVCVDTSDMSSQVSPSAPDLRAPLDVLIILDEM